MIMRAGGASLWWILRGGAVVWILLMWPLPQAASAQVGAPLEAMREIRSLDVQVDVGGSGADARLGGALEAVITEELSRSGVLFDLAPHRELDCCVLRLDVRVVRGRAGPWASQGWAAYTVRLELGQRERLGPLDAWMLLWAGPTHDDLVDPTALGEQLRFATREAMVHFIDGYRAVYPPR